VGPKNKGEKIQFFSFLLKIPMEKVRCILRMYQSSSEILMHWK